MVESARILRGRIKGISGHSGCVDAFVEELLGLLTRSRNKHSNHFLEQDCSGGVKPASEDSGRAKPCHHGRRSAARSSASGLGVGETARALKDNEKGIMDQYKQLPPSRTVHTQDASAHSWDRRSFRTTQSVTIGEGGGGDGANYTLTVIRPQTLRARTLAMSVFL